MRPEQEVIGAARHGARHAVNLITPALATAYSGQPWLVVPSPATDATVMIAPRRPTDIKSHGGKSHGGRGL